MSRAQLALLTATAMVAFATNSLLCRAALQQTAIDPASFTTVRIASGALMLWLIVRMRGGAARGGSWASALALLAYAAAFSFAYTGLTAATGALLLFGAVQATMVGHGLYSGERLRWPQVIGIAIAAGGLIWLLLPGLAAPPPVAAALMLAAGVAWGVYSLRGRGAGDPTVVSAGNFARAVPLAVLVSIVMIRHTALDIPGLAIAVVSGAVASSLGYIVWYSALPALKAMHAATVQLSVPVIAALGGVAFLGEHITVRLAATGAAILGGIALVILEKRPAVGEPVVAPAQLR